MNTHTLSHTQTHIHICTTLDKISHIFILNISHLKGFYPHRKKDVYMFIIVSLCPLYKIDSFTGYKIPGFTAARILFELVIIIADAFILEWNLH